MMKAWLESYIGIKKEIEQLESYLREGVPQTFDVVRSSAEFPYNPHSVVVTGADMKLLDAWNNRLRVNRKLKSDIETFIESVPNEKIRLAMRYRYYDGLPWQTVAMRCGWQDPRTPQQRIEKYLINAC